MIGWASKSSPVDLAEHFRWKISSLGPVCINVINDYTRYNSLFDTYSRFVIDITLYICHVSAAPVSRLIYIIVYVYVYVLRFLHCKIDNAFAVDVKIKYKEICNSGEMRDLYRKSAIVPCNLWLELVKYWSVCSYMDSSLSSFYSRMWYFNGALDINPVDKFDATSYMYRLTNTGIPS